jgi:DNA replication regulator DPB11
MFGGNEFGAPALLLSHRTSGDSASDLNMIDDDGHPDAPPSKKQRLSPSTSPPPQIPPSSPSSGSLSDEALVPPPSIAEIKRDMKRTRIPSSKSPSPLKIPPQPNPQPLPQSAMHPDASPPKVSKALHESITNLLEKGHQADTEAGANQNPVTRSGKRPRPLGRTRVCVLICLL